MTRLTKLGKAIDDLGKLNAKAAVLTEKQEVVKVFLRRNMEPGAANAREGDLFRCTLSGGGQNKTDWKAVAHALSDYAPKGTFTRLVNKNTDWVDQEYRVNIKSRVKAKTKAA